MNTWPVALLMLKLPASLPPGEAEIRGIAGLSVINDGARGDGFADGTEIRGGEHGCVGVDHLVVSRCHRESDGLGAAVAGGISGDHIKVVSSLGTGIRGGIDEHLACGTVDAEAASIPLGKGSEASLASAS